MIVVIKDVELSERCGQMADSEWLIEGAIELHYLYSRRYAANPQRLVEFAAEL